MIGFLEIVFASKLNCFNEFGLHISNETLHTDMRRCHSELHKYGKAHHVRFDPATELQHIVALNGGEGLNFKLLGIPFKNALSMHDAVVELVSETR